MTGLHTTNREILYALRDDLPQLLRDDPSFSAYILSVAREHFSNKVETEDRFTRMLGELARDREEQARKWKEQKAEDKQKWEEQNRKWEEQAREWKEQKAEDKQKWEEQNRKWDEQAREWKEQKAEDKQKWEEQNRKWDEQNRKQDLKWDEQNRKWEEQNRKWEESGHRFDEMHKAIIAQGEKHERSIGALGARWGLQSEKAFRDALAGILGKSFGVEVLNVTEFDDEGEVFGRSDQVELDIIVRNGLLIICELKSSVDKAAMYTFERKVRFYEKRHRRQAERMIVISPMIGTKARRVGERLGIEMYADSPDVPVV